MTSPSLAIDRETLTMLEEATDRARASWRRECQLQTKPDQRLRYDLERWERLLERAREEYHQ